MFEFRWHRDARELRVGKREQIRHYDAELIQKAQNKEIDRAIAVYEQQASDGRETVS